MTWQGRDSDDADWWTNVALVAVGVAVGLGAAGWLGASVAAVITSHPVPPFDPSGVLRLLESPSAPSAAWRSPMPASVLYWGIQGALFLIVAGCVTVGTSLIRRRDPRATRQGARSVAGTAKRSDVRRAAGRRALLNRAAAVRPTLRRPDASDVGYKLGTSRGVPVWATVEDSLLLLGPPRSGKGLHVVIPAILDAPGAVVSTSTRPDNLAVTIDARRAIGPVAVFDPQNLAPGVTGGLRWSPLRGCEDPQTAMIRARGLAAGTGLARGGVEGGDFWQGQTEAVLRGLLHAGALGKRGAADLYRWSLSPVLAHEALAILASHADAATGWDEAIAAATDADPRTRDSIWLGVRQALASLADPRVLAAVSPGPGEAFDPEAFIRDRGTLYLLATSAGAGAAANLVAAFIEDMLETARRLAARAAGGRLDPPLLLALDEIGNLSPLPSLPSLMSDGGGTGITTLTVLQSLAQARAGWGEQAAHAIWDSAIVKIILGGGSNARDLADLATLIGDRDDETRSSSRDHRGHRTTSTSVRRIPIMDTARLRTLPVGTAVLLLRTAAPIVLDLVPWTARPDAKALQAARAGVESDVLAASQLRGSDSAADRATGASAPRPLPRPSE